jgi:type II secretory pathway component PulM
MRREKDNRGLVIKILIAVVVVLVLVMLYFFVVQPSVDRYVFNKQIEAQSYVFADMVNQLQNQGFYQVQLGNQTLVLIPPQLQQ